MLFVVTCHSMHDFRKGDYFRYLAEFKTDQDRKEAADQSLKGYEAFIFSITFKLTLEIQNINCLLFLD